MAGVRLCGTISQSEYIVCVDLGGLSEHIRLDVGGMVSSRGSYEKRIQSAKPISLDVLVGFCSGIFRASSWSSCLCLQRSNQAHPSSGASGLTRARIHSFHQTFLIWSR